MLFPLRIIFLTMFGCLFACIPMAKQRGNISYEQAIEIAGKEALRLGYDIKSMELQEISKHYDPWNNYLPRKSNSEYVLLRRDKLKGKEYWAVYYGRRRKPGRRGKGGGICVFIDSATGEILTTYRGK